jgi:hypothetical protein
MKKWFGFAGIADICITERKRRKNAPPAVIRSLSLKFIARIINFRRFFEMEIKKTARRQFFWYIRNSDNYHGMKRG